MSEHPESKQTDLNNDSGDAYPDSPVSRVEIEHADGTVKELTGDDAQTWVEWVDTGVGLAVAHGHSAPDVPWNVLQNTTAEKSDTE